MDRKVALITGITGQDGSYLAELLLSEGYEVHGIKRRASSYNTSRIDHIFGHPRLKLHYGDVVDCACMMNILMEAKPTEVYNLAAQSHVKVSFEMPVYTAQVDAVGVVSLLEAIRSCGMMEKVKFYQASTSELYGKIREPRQSETTPFYPRSPYGCAKIMSFWIVKNYREAYGMFAVNGILFNHESERRGETFVTRKISLAVANIVAGKQETLTLGNLDAKRDWGHAADYVRGMWMMLQAEKPEDYVLATGDSHTVREFCELAFLAAGIHVQWKGSGVEEIGVGKVRGEERVLVNVSSKYYRPAEVDVLLGDPRRAEKALGWKASVPFPDLVKRMVLSDISLVGAELQ